MEGLLRRLVWVFREKPLLAYGAVAGIGVGVVALAVRRFSRSTVRVLHLSELEADFGLLRQLVDSRWALTSKSGELTPLSTHTKLVEEKDVKFLLTTVDADAVARKPGASTRKSLPATQRTDAFASVKDAQRVARMFGTHSLLFNKFYVVPKHIVAITDTFQSQEEPLNVSDMTVAWSLVTALDGVAFYNGGFQSGASQPRRHVQFMAFDMLHQSLDGAASATLRSKGAELPLDLLISEWRASQGWAGSQAGQPYTLPALPFPHTLWLHGSDIHRTGFVHAAETLHSRYMTAVKQQEAASRAAGARHVQANSHNLIVTPTWMLFVPRTREFGLSGGRISVNALGYCGLLLARPPDDVELVQSGLLHALARCTHEQPDA